MAGWLVGDWLVVNGSVGWLGQPRSLPTSQVPAFAGRLLFTSARVVLLPSCTHSPTCWSTCRPCLRGCVLGAVGSGRRGRTSCWHCTRGTCAHPAGVGCARPSPSPS